MKSRFYTTHAFTLIEVIVGMVVVSIIGAAAWMAVNVLSPASEATRLRIKAEHLITLSEEELHQYASIQTQFDTTLSSCNFDQPNNNCNFADVSSQFPEFTRTLTYLTANSKTGIKEFKIHVTWQELGKLQFKDSVVWLVRPADPLPGNIYGLAYDSNNPSVILGNVQIAAINLPGTDTTSSNPVLLSANPDEGRYNYTFAIPPNNYFVLGQGTWHLKAHLDGYKDVITDRVIQGSRDDERADFPMERKVADASISGSAFDSTTGQPVTFSNNSVFQLYEKGALATNVSPSPASQGGSYRFNFDVSFNDNNQRCFTLVTYNTYQSRSMVGTFPWNGFSYQANGWSSAVATPANAPLNCPEGWNGSAACDNICVKPTDTKTINPQLIPAPTTIVNVTVVDAQTGKPVNATPDNQIRFTVNWYDGTPFNNTQSFSSSIDDPVIVPAEQDMNFTNNPQNNVQISAQWNAPMLQCCDKNATVQVTSETATVSLHDGNPSGTAVLHVNTTTPPQQCGDANGNVIDAKTSGALPDAVVVVSGISQTTDGGGIWALQCSQTPPFIVPSGPSAISATANGYYPFSNQGNTYYHPTGLVTITANQPNDLGTIPLWPMGFGTIKGIVVEQQQGSDVPMNGVIVNLNLGVGQCPAAGCQFTTGPDGTFEFDNVPETWPPSNNPILNPTVLNHTVSVAAVPGSYGAASSGPLTLIAGGIDDNVRIVLIPTSGA